MKYGLPGQYLTSGNRFAQLLAHQSPEVNNGSTAGGLAHMLNQGLLGYIMGKEGRDSTQADQLMAEGMQAKPWVNPDTGAVSDAPAGGMAGAISALGKAPGNEHAGRLSRDLMMQQAAGAAARDDYLFQQRNKALTTPAAIAEFEYARNNGFTGSFEDWKKTAGAGNTQETYGNNPIWGTGPDGKPVLLQTSNRGGVKEVALPPGVTPQRGQTSRVDLGNDWGILDANGTLIGRMPKGIAPERTIQNGQVVTLPGVSGGGIQPGATLSVAGETGLPPGAPQGVPGAVPTGAPSVTELPPTPEERREMEKAAQQEAMAAEVRNRASDVVLDSLDRAMQTLATEGNAVAGWGSLTAGIPGSRAKDFKETIAPIVANLGFDRLQQMRDSSPTGGALGAINERELSTLQAVLGSLDQAQSPAQLRRNMARLKNTYLDIVHGPGNGPERLTLDSPAGAGPQPNAVEDGFRFKGGDPADPRSWEPIS